MSTVYIVQCNDKRMDFGPAKPFGELKIVLGSGLSVFRRSEIVEALYDGLSDWRSGDYLLPVGNPTTIGLAFAVLSDICHGEVNVLHWVAREREYVPLKFILRERD